MQSVDSLLLSLNRIRINYLETSLASHKKESESYHETDFSQFCGICMLIKNEIEEIQKYNDFINKKN